MRINVVGDKAYVYTPYNQTFVTKVKRIGGSRWDASLRAWVVPSNAVDAIRKHMLTCYGETDIPEPDQKRYDVTLTFPADDDYFGGTRRDFVIFGRTLSHAWSRDSGASLGDGVIYLKGAPISGGSAKYWMSGVKRGSVIILSDVPESIIESETRRYEDVTYEIVEKTTAANRTKLEEEKEKLLSRIAAIDDQLASM